MIPIFLITISIVPFKLALKSPALKPISFPSAVANTTIIVTSSEFDGAANVFKKDKETISVTTQDFVKCTSIMANSIGLILDST